MTKKKTKPKSLGKKFRDSQARKERASEARMKQAHEADRQDVAALVSGWFQSLADDMPDEPGELGKYTGHKDDPDFVLNLHESPGYYMIEKVDVKSLPGFQVFVDKCEEMDICFSFGQNWLYQMGVWVEPERSFVDFLLRELKDMREKGLKEMLGKDDYLVVLKSGLLDEMQKGAGQAITQLRKELSKPGMEEARQSLKQFILQGPQALEQQEAKPQTAM